MNKIGFAGNKGLKVRSDCYVSIELTEKGGRKIEVSSKVKVLFGNAIEKRIHDFLDFFGIDNCHLELEDKGALDYVLMARLEAALNKIEPQTKSYLPEIIPENQNFTQKEDFRFSRLYLPGNTPSLAINAGLHHPNGIILDLEDAVSIDKKHEAKYLVRNTLRQVNFYGAERMMRINQIPMGLDDIQFGVGHGVQMFLIPKCENEDQIHQVNAEIDKIKLENNVQGDIWLMPIIESALGVENAYKIASAAKNIVSMAVGLEDLTSDLGTQRTSAGNETFFARSRVVNACRAAGIQPIDSVFSDISDMEALAKNVQTSKALGFDGMGCIHPRQIAVVHENFAPSEKEILKAKKIVHAYMNASEKGLGVVSLGSKMIDAPVVKRAQRTLKLAIALEMVSENWREEFLTKEN